MAYSGYVVPIILALLLAAPNPGAERERAWKLLRQHVNDAGLLHDIDLPATAQEMSRHGVVGALWIAGAARADEVLLKARQMPAKQGLIKKLTAECPAPLPQASEMALKAISSEGTNKP